MFAGISAVLSLSFKKLKISFPPLNKFIGLCENGNFWAALELNIASINEIELLMVLSVGYKNTSMSDTFSHAFRYCLL